MPIIPQRKPVSVPPAEIPKQVKVEYVQSQVQSRQHYCIACEGTGKSSRNEPCVPCNGSGVSQ